eukprot:CAMPEP_0179421504 /NCGR_PEP_ID=MMETSP0799-20121207/9823_1 /TAXON_ID=46947 /ORGANISM="Geminigera cryophila, Strain CCMP2564" /LENGTH=57 /DNA_ID=CAMNT_0021195359 /DNA_START=1320 /DNA_END=1493 /DNA_ORIENTATION=-
MRLPTAVVKEPMIKAREAIELHSRMPIQASVALPQAREKMAEMPSSACDTMHAIDAR